MKDERTILRSARKSVGGPEGAALGREVLEVGSGNGGG